MRLNVDTSPRWKVIWATLWIVLVGWSASALAAPKPELWVRWQAHETQSQVHVDHTAWDRFLGSYVVADHPSGVNRVRYGQVSPEDKKALEAYLTQLQGIRVSNLNRSEQKAFWINLYNALTVKVVLDHHPVDSIRDIDISPGWFSDGPWEGKLVRVEGEDVSLDDIEHRILRPIWKDNRVHYGVNCASIGCPNLQSEAFTRSNTDRLLQTGARDYVNHSRGVRLDGNTLILSSIYDWFQVDFGGSENTVIQHLLIYADRDLTPLLKGFDGRIRYEYDWSLNDF
jgi:hypothetical protein